MTAPIRECDHLFKILLIGDSGVGKSALMSRYSDQIFNEPYIPTVGVEFKVRTIEIEGKRIKLKIWDTANQELSADLNSRYYRGAHGIMAGSFNSVKQWLRQIDLDGFESVSKILVGNKSDLSTERAVNYNIAKSFADELSIPFIETSARSGEEAVGHVEQAFITIATEIKNRVDLQQNYRPRWSVRTNLILQALAIFLTYAAVMLAILAIPALQILHNFAFYSVIFVFLAAFSLTIYVLYCIYRMYQRQLV